MIVLPQKMQEVASCQYKVMQLDSRRAVDMLYVNKRLIHHVREEMGDHSYGVCCTVHAERERDRQTETERERQRQRERGERSMCVPCVMFMDACVSMCVRICVHACCVYMCICMSLCACKLCVHVLSLIHI